MSITWHWKTFAELTVSDLYDLLKLRQDVFLIEQDCLYADLDGWDDRARHLLACNGAGELVAYCRAFRSGIKYPGASIGRVITAESYRGQGIGHEMIDRSVAFCREQEPKCAIRIVAQSHLKKFYGEHGFECVSEEFEEHGIPHVTLMLTSR